MLTSLWLPYRSFGTVNDLFVFLKPLKSKEVVMAGLIPAIHVGRGRRLRLSCKDSGVGPT